MDTLDLFELFMETQIVTNFLFGIFLAIMILFLIYMFSLARKVEAMGTEVTERTKTAIRKTSDLISDLIVVKINKVIKRRNEDEND